MDKTIEKASTFAIMGYFKNNKKWLYYGSDFSSDGDWTSHPWSAVQFDCEERVTSGYKTIVKKHSATFTDGSGSVINKEGMPDRLKVVIFDLSVSDTDLIDDDFLKKERQKSALNKLSRQELEDLGLIDFAVLHRLEQED